MKLNQTVAAICAHFCARMDENHPGTLTGLYLVGSIALGDYRAGTSDVDFIAVLDHPLPRQDLVDVHTDMRSQFTYPYFDGIYVEADALGRDPRETSAGFSVIGGNLQGPDREERHAVTWLTLAHHGVALRGPGPSPNWVWADLAAAQQHARDNLSAYWRRLLDWHHHQIKLGAPLSNDRFVWAVLGVGRLHALIVEARLLSKGQAADYERRVFPAYAALITEAADLRAGDTHPKPYPAPSSRYATMVEFLDAVIADGLK